MRRATFEKTRTKNPDVRILQDSVASSFKQVASKEILEGKLVDSVEIPTGGVVQVPHGLSRAPRGWIVTRKSANADIWDSQTENTTPSRTLALNSSATVTISLWVF